MIPGIVACTRCGARFSEGAKFCGRCQNTAFMPVPITTTIQTFNCPRCATALPVNSKFCGRCGLQMTQNLNISQSPSVQSQIHQTNPPMVERVCRRCGNSYPPNIKFCGRCGLNLLN